MIDRLMKPLPVVLLLLACLPPVVAGGADDQRALQGTWSELSEKFDGAAAPQQLLVGNRTEFSGTGYVHIYRNEFSVRNSLSHLNR